MVNHFEFIPGEELRKLMVDMVKVFAKFDPTDFVLYWYPFIQENLEIKKERLERYEKCKKKIFINSIRGNKK